MNFANQNNNPFLGQQNNNHVYTNQTAQYGNANTNPMGQQNNNHVNTNQAAQNGNANTNPMAEDPFEGDGFDDEWDDNMGGIDNENVAGQNENVGD